MKRDRGSSSLNGMRNTPHDDRLALHKELILLVPT